MQHPQTGPRPRAIGTVAAVAAGVLAAAGIGAAAIGFTSTLSSPAPPADPCATVSAAAAPSNEGSDAFRDGMSCAVLDSLVQKKIRRDAAQKIAAAAHDDPSLLQAYITGSDVARITREQVVCADASEKARAGDVHAEAIARLACAIAPPSPSTPASPPTS